MPILFLLAAHEVDALTTSDTSRHHDYSYSQTSNISHTLVSNKIVDHSDVVGASPVGAAPTTSSYWLNTWLQEIAPRQLQDETRNI